MHPVLLFALLSACDGEAPADPPTETDTDLPKSEDACAARVVRLQTGPDETCTGGNVHTWPVDLAPSDCHGWSGEDPSGRVHENSASAIGCNPDGSFSFTQYAGNLDCSGEGVTKTFEADVCTQDIPPSLYTRALDLSCCADPEGPDCLVEVPSVSVPGGSVTLNGTLCTTE